MNINLAVGLLVNFCSTSRERLLGKGFISKVKFSNHNNTREMLAI